MRPKVVLKFGGSSLVDERCMRRVAEIAADRLAEAPLVVVSAMGSTGSSIKITDHLQRTAVLAMGGGDWLRALGELRRRHEEVLGGLTLSPTLLDGAFEAIARDCMLLEKGSCAPRTRCLDLLMGWGEILSSRIMADLLREKGFPCRAILPEECGFITNDNFQNADLLESSLKTVADAVIASRENLVFPGYIGITPDGRRTTLGRGGSDYTAALLGAALKRDVEIWTDVDGIYRANPSYFDAKMRRDGHPATIPELSHDEAFQMAAFGSKVLYEKSLHAARMAARKGKNIRFLIRNTFNPEHPGTAITSVRRPQGIPRGITCLEKTQLLTFYPRDEEQGSAILRDVVAVRSADMKLSSRTTGRMSFVFDRYCDELRALEEKYEGHLSKDQVLVKIVGDGLGENHDMLARIHHSLEMAENPGKYGMTLVHKSPLLLSDDTFEILVKKRGIQDVVLQLYKDLFLEHEIHIGIFGLGTVGAGVVQYANELYSREKTGYDLRFHAAVVRDPAKKRPVDFPGTITTDPDAILGDPRIDVVIELMGGIEPAKSIIIEAFRRGKHVVTANKALLSQFGREIFQAAAKYRRNIGFEASVAGEIPVIDDYLKIPSKSDVLALEGIINGTTNFILSSMMEGAEYDTALAEAQSGGFAEADPSFDVDGHDAAQKLAILSSILFHTDVDVRAISLQGITALLAVDCETARLWGYTIKPCASARRIDETLMLRVCPAFIPMGHALYSVSREMNALALYLKGREEPITKIGKGAGAIPTARSIMRDVLEVGKKVRRHVVDLPLYATSAQRLPIRDEDTLEAPFYLRFSVDDTPGVFGRVATILGDWDLSISQAHQREKQKDEPWSHILLQVKRTTLGKVKGAFSLIAREPFAHDLLYCMILQ